MPYLLWLYHMGVILFWIHDSSPKHRRTYRLSPALGSINSRFAISGSPKKETRSRRFRRAERSCPGRRKWRGPDVSTRVPWGPLAIVARELVEYFAAEFANSPPACLDDVKQRLSRKVLFGNRSLRGESRRGSPLKRRFPGAIGELGAGRNELPFRRLELHLHTAELAPDSIYWQCGGGTWR